VISVLNELMQKGMPLRLFISKSSSEVVANLFASFLAYQFREEKKLDLTTKKSINALAKKLFLQAEFSDAGADYWAEQVTKVACDIIDAGSF
jgi:hypothetical protein